MRKKKKKELTEDEKTKLIEFIHKKEGDGVLNDPVQLQKKKI